MYHLKLIKALSYSGIVTATNKKPDVFVEDKTTADAAVATGYFKLLESRETSEQTTQFNMAQLEEMKVDDLKQLAANIGINTIGFKRKTDYVEAIIAAEDVPDEKNEVDYEEESPIMTALQKQ